MVVSGFRCDNNQITYGSVFAVFALYCQQFCYYVDLVCCFTLPGGGLQIVYSVHVPLFIVDLPLKVGLVVLQVVLILS